ncbi:transcription initiation factor TFIID component TAF4 family-domain-containing protein [Suillus paluster]|uniref:transcription initiation factor TFIID component TAF4 family-domain-containing protein n=1 Tax=Suillus paluster TaxID=48578 RepID=UPI001B86E1ED|nr:transcription initiation factor TFIID component TAF4 family-domain-containing protein [Suillus paluster]KAG1717515.1 transcription initiation factor TFIID component TAF4 family-domain-containing protein [Suillus paluster]
MKTESEAPKTPTPTQTHAQTSYTAQWGTTHIPIDPALQQQSQHATTTPYSYQYTHHYPQAAYSHYSYVPQQAQAQVQRQQTSTTPVTGATTQAANANSGMDTADVATLNDALGSAGVDLRAEEESLQRSHDSHQSYRTFEDRSRKQPATPSFDTRFLGATMRTIGTEHKVTKIPEDSVNYLAIALRARLQDLVTAMIAATYHRTDTQFDRPACLYDNGTPMWSIVVQKRKERADLAAAHAANLSAQASGGNAMAVDGDEEGGAKKKKKKEGPGVTARNMSEDVRKKMSNAVASQAAGLGGKYAWMNAANSSATSGKPKPAASSAAATSPATTTTPATTTAPAASTTATTSWARPYVGKKGSPTSPLTGEDDDRMPVTMRDAMFAIEKERGHGGGRGSARGWS